MNGKAGAATSGVDNLILGCRIHHLYTHINDISRRKILAFFTLLSLAHQIFKGIIYNIKIVVK